MRCTKPGGRRAAEFQKTKLCATRFSVSLSRNPDSPGSMVIIRDQGRDRGTNLIEMTFTNNQFDILVNGKGCR